MIAGIDHAEIEIDHRREVEIDTDAGERPALQETIGIGCGTSRARALARYRGDRRLAWQWRGEPRHRATLLVCRDPQGRQPLAAADVLPCGHLARNRRNRQGL